MSTVVVIVLVVVAILLLALLIAGVRRATSARRHPGDGSDPYRSHAEASRDRGDPHP